MRWWCRKANNLVIPGRANESARSAGQWREPGISLNNLWIPGPREERVPE
jgi:hypothetical protein